MQLTLYANTFRRRAQGSIAVQEMELSDLASVRAAAAALDERCKVVDFLILNAGVAVRGCHTYADCTFAQTQSYTLVTPQKRVRFDCLQSSCRIYVSSEHPAGHFSFEMRRRRRCRTQKTVSRASLASTTSRTLC